MRTYQKQRQTNGFTLLELVVVIMIIGVIAGIGTKILSSGFTGFFDNKNLAEANWQALVSLERLQRDLRAIRSPADITTATATSLVFNNTSGNQITYTLSGSTLTRQTNSNSAQVLADGVGSLAFSYYDNNGQTTATLNLIRQITIALNITLDNTNYSASTAVYPRNLS
jgi:prepilin-type N-terminal cleavage/methylation domain-containing protein